MRTPEEQSGPASETRVVSAEGHLLPHRIRRSGLAALALYVALALVSFWRLFAVGFGNSLPRHSPDAYQEVWFLAWLPHALGAGENPFHSAALFAPHGVNLLANASLPALALLSSPVTVIFGPVASFDVLCIAAPALSAFAAFLAARRFVCHPAPAFIAGFCFGFGPFLRTDLQFGHLHITFLALLPTLMLLLTDLLRSSEGSQIPRGLAVGGLLVVQFFISSELLVISLVMAGIGLVVLALGNPAQTGALLRRIWPGLLAALSVTVACLAYPVWYALSGPRHIVGPVWPDMGHLGASLTAAVLPHAERAGVGFISGGNGNYLGIGLVVVLTLGLAYFFDDRTIRFFFFMALAAELLTLGYWLHVGSGSTGVPLPGWLFSRLPVLDSVVMSRFAAPLDLFVGILLAVILDRLLGRLAERSQPGQRRLLWSKLTVGVVALVAVVPLVFEPISWGYREGAVPAVPSAFSRLKATGGHRPLVLVYPDTALASAEQMVWQARQNFSFSDSEGYAIIPGAGGHSTESLPVDAISLVFAAAYLHHLALPLSPSAKESLERDLATGHVNRVLVDLRAPAGQRVRRALTEVLGSSSTVGSYALWNIGSLRSP